MAFLALQGGDDPEMNDSEDYSFSPQGIDAAIQRADDAANSYFIDTSVPIDPVVTPQAAQDLAIVSAQQDAIYVPSADIPIYQGYGTTDGSLKGWQQDLDSLTGGVSTITSIVFQGTEEGTIGGNAYNAYMNQLNANQTEGMLNWAKWADYEEQKKATTGTLDISDMEQLAAWLYVNERDDYDEFVAAWKTMGGQTQTSANWAGVNTSSVKVGTYGDPDLAWSNQEQTTIQNLALQLSKQPKQAQYGSFYSTPAPMYVDVQGNQVNAYTGVIMVKAID
jgi:hypothetical protein